MKRNRKERETRDAEGRNFAYNLKRIHQRRGAKYTLADARSAVKIFQFLVGKKGRHDIHTRYIRAGLKQRTRAIRPTNRCFIRACPARRIEENRPGVPRATCSNLLHSRCNPVCYTCRYAETSHRDSQGGENPRVSSTVYWTSNTSCLARLLAYVAQRTREFVRTRVITSDKAFP